MRKEKGMRYMRDRLGWVYRTADVRILTLARTPACVAGLCNKLGTLGMFGVRGAAWLG